MQSYAVRGAAIKVPGESLCFKHFGQHAAGRVILDANSVACG